MQSSWLRVISKQIQWLTATGDLEVSRGQTEGIKETVGFVHGQAFSCWCLTARVISVPCGRAARQRHVLGRQGKGRSPGYTHVTRCSRAVACWHEWLNSWEEGAGRRRWGKAILQCAEEQARVSGRGTIRATQGRVSCSSTARGQVGVSEVAEMMIRADAGQTQWRWCACPVV